MTFEEMKIAVVIAWAMIWSVIAMSLVSSPSTWVMLVGAGVLPPLVLVLAQMRHPQPVPVSTRL